MSTLLQDSLHLVAGKSVGLITNHTGKDETGTPTIDLLFEHQDIDLVALYSPEHGIRGNVEAGVEVDSGLDSETGLPVHSLYGATRKPTPEMLAGVDVLLFDIQDVGARYYTYLSTMVLGMEAAGEAQIPFVVLDRPNPIGGHAQGNILDPAYSTFVGLFAVPMRHGLTAGEFARMAAGEFGVNAELTVAPMAGWTRDLAYEDTGVPWTAPSPNMPSVASALHYPGTCLFEGTVLSVGRGTDQAFQQVGAPWLDEVELADALNALSLQDVRFEAVRFTPSAPGDGKFDGEEVGGVRLAATGPRYDPTKAALAILIAAKAMSGESWEWHVAHFDRLSGTDQLRLDVEAGVTLEALTSGWDSGLMAFEGRAAPYWLYP
ncbi:MAG: exo-beta-N-acetylmuramidase NamZ family protein [Longimicrobiales bacterium]